MKIIIGIDPGKYGAVSCIIDGAFKLVDDTPLIKNERTGKMELHLELMKALLLNAMALKRSGHKVMAFIEHQHPFPGQGGVANFTNGKGFGIWLGLLHGCGIPFIVLTTSSWRRNIFNEYELQLTSRPFGKKKLTKEQKTEIKKTRKMMSIGKAVNLYKSCSGRVQGIEHEGRAEAILIAHGGEIEWQKQLGVKR